MRRWTMPSLDLVVAAAIAILVAGNAPASAGALFGPPEKAAALRADPDASFDFIVSAKEAFPNSLEARIDALAEPQGSGLVTELPLITSVMAKLHVRDAEALAADPAVRRVWYVHEDLAPLYGRVIRALAADARQGAGPMVVNISLGPPADLIPMAFSDDEPMNEATGNAAKAGLVIIMAIGNYGPTAGYVNPWCRPDWMTCVGAADETAKTMWVRSARGLPGDPTTWPDVVADGIDVIGPFPTNLAKSPSRRAHDDGNPIFAARVRPEKRALYTIGDGTSFATPQVTRAAAQIVFFVQHAATEARPPIEGRNLFSLTLTKAAYQRSLGGRGRYAGKVVATSADGVEVGYALTVPPWRLVKQLLIDTSIDMPGVPRDQQGAGFVSPDYVERQFGRFGKAHITIDPQKVTGDGTGEAN